MIGKEVAVVVQANSTDPHSNMSLLCQEVFTAILVNKDNSTLFPSGMTPTKVYSVNYPLPLRIPLEGYVLGPNIEYQLKNKKGDDIPPYWINKVNKTSINMDYPPLPGDIVFFHSDVIPQLGQEILIYYYQDTSYKTHVALCSHNWESANIDCTL